MEKSKLEPNGETFLIRLRIGHTVLTHGCLIAKEEPPHVLMEHMVYCAHNKTCIITEYLQRYEQGRLNHGLTESLDVTLGPNHEQNEKIFNFLKFNDLLLTKYNV